jgi:hypothetical protein
MRGSSLGIVLGNESVRQWIQVVSCHRHARVERSYFLVKYGRMGEDLQCTFCRIAQTTNNTKYAKSMSRFPLIWFFAEAW